MLRRWPAIRKVKISSLIAAAGGCGIALSTMAVLLNKESTGYASRAGFVNTALDMIEKEPVVLDMIGQPYALGQAKLLNIWFGGDTNNVKVRIPVKGPNDTAFIYAFARRQDVKDKLKLFKIEMTFNKFEGKKMILFDVEDKGIEHGVELIEPEVKKPKEVKKKTSPIPEGMIPNIDPNEPRRLPRSVIRHKKAAQTDATTTTTTANDSSDTSSGGDQKPPPS